MFWQSRTVRAAGRATELCNLAVLAVLLRAGNPSFAAVDAATYWLGVAVVALALLAVARTGRDGAAAAFLARAARAARAAAIVRWHAAGPRHHYANP